MGNRNGANSAMAQQNSPANNGNYPGINPGGNPYSNNAVMGPGMSIGRNGRRGGGQHDIPTDHDGIYLSKYER